MTRKLITALLSMLLFFAMAGCSHPGYNPPDGAQQLSEKIAQSLASGTLEGFEIAGDAEAARAEYEEVTAAMFGLLPQVSVGKIEYAGTKEQPTAQVALNHNYTFTRNVEAEPSASPSPAESTSRWAFTTKADLVYDGVWKLSWAPNIVHPQLNEYTRLVYERTTPKRGGIFDRDGQAIVSEQPVNEIGIDKTKLNGADAATSAAALAKLVGVDAEAYAAKVTASGPEAFVKAITVRSEQSPEDVEKIPGAVSLGTTLPLAPSESYAGNIFGTVGEATAEEIENSDSLLSVGDLVGKQGLQKSADGKLRGQTGHKIMLKFRKDISKPDQEELAAPQGESAEPVVESDLFSLAPKGGEQIKTTMSKPLQDKLEAALAESPGKIAVAALDKDGGIIAAGASPAWKEQPISTAGQFPPGSTMKVASSLALLRRGETPDSTVDCSETVSVGGKEFKNYPGYPKAFTGKIKLSDALAQSCNTAFVNAKITSKELSGAAASLGMGIDYDAGFESFYGAVPTTEDPVVAAANSFGQGHVLASPMALAAMSGSVNSGKTLIAHLRSDVVPSPEGGELTEAEAAQLKEMMSGVIKVTGSGYAKWLAGAKTGTAEFEEGGKVKTHIWVTGFAGEMSVAIIDYDATNGKNFEPILAALYG